MDRHNCTDTIGDAMYSANLTPTLPLSWRGWWADGKRLLADEAVRVLSTVRVWRHRAHSRRQLEQLSEHLCRDIGLTHEQVRHEVAKAFWMK